MSKISVYIIAFNEAEKVTATIESARWADEIVVVDSWSTDGTPEIAAKLGARVVQVDFKGFGDLRNQAIAACSHEWIFSLDADETLHSRGRARNTGCDRGPQGARRLLDAAPQLLHGAVDTPLGLVSQLPATPTVQKRQHVL